MLVLLLNLHVKNLFFLFADKQAFTPNLYLNLIFRFIQYSREKCFVCPHAVSNTCLHFFLIFLAFNRFFDMVNSITEEIGKTTEEGECDGDSLEVYSVFFVVF